MRTQEPALFVIFGGTGDLARRKLLPALNQSALEGRLNARTHIVGVGRKALPDGTYRAEIANALGEAGFTGNQMRNLLGRTHYLPIGRYEPADFRTLRQSLDALREEHGLPANYGFYLALPPDIMLKAVAGLGSVDLNASDKGYSRIVLEKPFGRDLASAEDLNALVHEHFNEDQIYRIDHFLGKETVQNLLVFRLANGFIESAWNRERVDSIQITVGETLGIGSRADYYDQAGALRDIIQNHMIQLLTLVAMEAPADFSADAIRYEKIKVLRQVQEIRLENVVRGQYTTGLIDGDRVCGYLEEDRVSAGSDTETFMAVKLFVDSWRWQGVPFYLRTGKRLPKKLSQIAVRFKAPPVPFFQKLDKKSHTSNVLVLTLQPDEGFSFHFGLKAPGYPFRLEHRPLMFRYSDTFDSMPDAYQTLLLDFLEGDQTLFVDSEEVQESWRLFTSVLEHPPVCKPYASGTWGPDEARMLAIPERYLWEGH